MNEKRNIAIENIKLKLHIKYILVISSLVMVFIGIFLSFLWPYNIGLADKVGFAGTVSSIILSVLAIIVTLLGEGKVDQARDRIDSSTEQLETVTTEVKLNFDNLKEAIYQMKDIKTTINERLTNFEGLFILKDEKEVDSNISSQNVELLDVFNEMIKLENGNEFLVAICCARYAREKNYKLVIPKMTTFVFQRFKYSNSRVHLSLGVAAVFIKLYRMDYFNSVMEEELTNRNIKDELNAAIEEFEDLIDEI